MGKIQVFADNYYQPWIRNPLENSFRLSAKENYSLDEFYPFIDNCNKDKITMLVGFYDKINNHIGNIEYDDINKFDECAHLIINELIIDNE